MGLNIYSICLKWMSYISWERWNIHRPNQLRFVLPISSHMNMPMGSFAIMLLFAFMAQLCMARNMLEKSKMFYQEIYHMTWNWHKQTFADFVYCVLFCVREVLTLWSILVGAIQWSKVRHTRPYCFREYHFLWLSCWQNDPLSRKIF